MLRHVAALAIDTVLTFDRHGVSGHKNHMSVHYAMACLAIEVRTDTGTVTGTVTATYLPTYRQSP